MGCNCLCAANHKKVRGVCTSNHDTDLEFYSKITGKVSVAMCSACATATLIQAGSTEGGNDGG